MPLCDDRQEFPAEVEYDAIRSFREKLLEIDEMMASSETKNKLFGDKADKYECVPIARQPQVLDDEDEAQKILPSSFLQVQIGSRTWFRGPKIQVIRWI